MSDRISMNTRQMFLLIFLMFFCGATSADETSFEVACSRIAPSLPNEVKVSIAGIEIDESKSTTEDMAVMAGLYNGIDRSIGGLTSAEPLFVSELEPNFALLPDGKGVCARPALKLTVGYSTMNVYMDREIPRGSCIYNAIFSHEMHHVAIYKDYVNHHVDQIKQSIDEKFNGKIYYFPTIFAAKQYMEILGQVFVQHVRDRFLGEVYAEQNALDTQAEYTRMQNECYH